MGVVLIVYKLCENRSATLGTAAPGGNEDLRLPSVDCRVSIAECRLPSVDCRVSIAECRVPSADCRGAASYGRSRGARAPGGCARAIGQIGNRKSKIGNPAPLPRPCPTPDIMM